MLRPTAPLVVAALGASLAVGLLPAAAAATSGPPGRGAPASPASPAVGLAAAAVRTTITGYDPPRALGVGQVLRDRVLVSGPAGRPVSLQVKRGTRWITLATVRTVANRVAGTPVAAFGVPMAKVAAAAGLRVRGQTPLTIFRVTTRVSAPKSGAASATTTTGRTTTATKTAKKLVGVVPEFVAGTVDVEHWWNGPSGPAPYTGITGTVRFVTNGGTAAAGSRALYALWTASLSWQAKPYAIDDCVFTGSGKATAANLISEQPYVVPVSTSRLARSTTYSFQWFQNAAFTPNAYFSCDAGILPSTLINALTFRTQVCQGGALKNPSVTRPAPGGAWAMSGTLPRTGTPCSTPAARESYDLAWGFTGVGWKEIYAP